MKIIKYKEHIFIKKEDEYNVKCLNTSGEFNSILWKNGKVKSGFCPCCNKIIK